MHLIGACVSFCEKYQIAHELAKINWHKAIMNAPIHNPANKKYIKAYLVLLSHVIEAKGELAFGVIVPTLYKNLKQMKINV